MTTALQIATAPGIQLTWFDRLLIGIAPDWGMRRVRARVMARHYEAAQVGRRTSGWQRFSSDANAASGPALTALRELSRDLMRNNGWAQSGVETIVNNTVGWGIVPKADTKAARPHAVWKAWASTAACDFDGRLNFVGLEALAMRTIVESGEVLIIKQPAATIDGLPVPLRIQVLEPDYIDTSRNATLAADGTGVTVIDGIEFDQQGRRTAYWLHVSHPGGSRLASARSRSVRTPASHVLHIYRVNRPGQVRGVAWLASAIAKIKDLDDFEDAELMQQKVAACFAAFVTSADGASTAIGAPGTDENGDDLDHLEPGHIAYLSPGEQVSFAQPPSPRDAAFSERTLRRIAASLGVTFEDMTGDYCVAPETRVLRADLRWVRADELIEGTEIVAFDESPPGGKGGRRKWRKASVVRAGRRNLNRRRIVTDGATVTVSDEHLFLCTSRGPTGAARGKGIQARSENPGDPGCGQRWVRADRLQPGDQIVFLCAPWATGTTHLHGYLKGISDGEGWVDINNAKIGIAQNPGPVLDEIGEALTTLGFRPQLNGNSKFRVRTWSTCGIGECLRFLGEVRPTRLLRHADRIYNGRMLSGGAKKNGRPTAVTVLAIDDLGVGPVVTLETSTKTLITEGLCSHNSHANYSGARMARLAHWQRVHVWRWQMFIPGFCGGVWRWVMELAAQLEGWPEVPGAEWSAPPMPILEPDKEGLAYQRLVRNGAMTWPQMIRELGEDPDAQLEEIQKFNAQVDKLGIALDCDPRKVTASGQMQSPGAGAAAKPADDDDAKPADEPVAKPPVDEAAPEDDTETPKSGDAVAKKKTPAPAPAAERGGEVKVFAYHQPFMKVKEIRDGIGLDEVEDDDLFAGEFVAKHGGAAVVVVDKSADKTAKDE